jgi:hypothetical protein
MGQKKNSMLNKRNQVKLENFALDSIEKISGTMGEKFGNVPTLIT